MEYGPNYKFSMGRRGLLKGDPTIKVSMPEAGVALGLAAAVGNLLGSKKKNPKTVTEPKRGRRVKKKEELKAKYSVKAPPSKPKFSKIILGLKAAATLYNFFIGFVLVIFTYFKSKYVSVFQVKTQSFAYVTILFIQANCRCSSAALLFG